MKRRGFTLVEIMIVVAIIALLAAIAIPNLLRARLTANESAAQATLRTISTALETYAAAHNGAYPTDEANLTNVTPPFLNRAYDTTTTQGFVYNYDTLNDTGYTVSAAAATCNTSGNNDYQVTTGGVLNSTPCS